MINHHDSWTHRLPPKILATMASHLEDDRSLVAATHVCHLWRTTLLSSPRIWSHLDFANEERALVFLERSKSAPLTVNLVDAYDPSEIVSELLNEIAIRVTALRAEYGPFLDELLARPMPTLEVMEVTGSGEHPPTYLPSLRSLDIHGFGAPGFPLGARTSVPGWYITSTSQGNGQCTMHVPTRYITNIFRIFPAGFPMMSPVRKRPVHSQCSRSCDHDVPIR